MTTERQMKILQYLIRPDSIEVMDPDQRLQVSVSTARHKLKETELRRLLLRQQDAVYLPPLIHDRLTSENRAVYKLQLWLNAWLGRAVAAFS